MTEVKGAPGHGPEDLPYPGSPIHDPLQTAARKFPKAPGVAGPEIFLLQLEGREVAVLVEIQAQVALAGRDVLEGYA